MLNMDEFAEILLDVVLIKNKETLQRRDSRKRYLKRVEDATPDTYFSEETQEEMIGLFNMNISLREIADRLKLPREKVRSFFKDMKRPPILKSHRNFKRKRINRNVS